MAFAEDSSFPPRRASFGTVVLAALVGASGFTGALSSGGDETLAGLFVLLAASGVPALLVGVVIALRARTWPGLVSGAFLVFGVAWLAPLVEIMILYATGHGGE